MVDSVAEIANSLDLSGRSPFFKGTFNEIHQSLVFFRTTHYEQYLPTLGSEHPDFEARLLDWLLNVAGDEDQALLLELASRIIFLTREDFAKLYQAALRGPVFQWLTDELGVMFNDPAFEEPMRSEIENHTWFTSITDSMQNSEFHHANHLGGIDHRPDWRSLAQFGDPAKIREYMASRRDAKGFDRPIRRIVILEDFVGTGTQMQMGSGSVSFAAETFSDVPILLCPLIICPAGAAVSRDLARRHKNLTFSPVLEITEDQLVSQHGVFPADSFEEAIRLLCDRLYPIVIGDDVAAPRPYTPWGFGATGSLIVLYTNTPANTLPVIQHRSNTWKALFPRSARIR